MIRYDTIVTVVLCYYERNAMQNTVPYGAVRYAQTIKLRTVQYNNAFLQRVDIDIESIYNEPNQTKINIRQRRNAQVLDLCV